MLSIALFIPLVGLAIDRVTMYSVFYKILGKLSGRFELDILHFNFFISINILIKNLVILFLNYYSDKSAYDTRREIRKYNNEKLS